MTGVIVYALTCCRVSIVHTEDVEGTVRRLSPDRVLTTEPGTSETERMRHRQFEGDRIRGEWFTYSPALAAHVVALRAGHRTAVTGNPGERMIDTASAIAWTGRDRQVLYRWAKEGRITRYGTPSRALWDVFQLPPKLPNGGASPPPPRRT